MHPEAAKSLFDAAVQGLRQNEPLRELNRWQILSADFPKLRVRMVHRVSNNSKTFQFDATDWNDQPLSLTVVDPVNGVSLPGDQWPKDTGGGHWHMNGHSFNNGPFLCMPGIREYHTHSGHTSDQWENYKNRPGFSFPEIVLKVSTAFHKADV